MLGEFFAARREDIDEELIEDGPFERLRTYRSDLERSAQPALRSRRRLGGRCGVRRLRRIDGRSSPDGRARRGVVRQIAVTWGTSTYTITYSALGSTSAIVAPANAQPLKRAIRP